MPYTNFRRGKKYCTKNKRTKKVGLAKASKKTRQRVDSKGGRASSRKRKSRRWTW
jgi:hypothetical protein